MDALDYIVKPVSYGGFKLRMERVLKRYNATRRNEKIFVKTDDSSAVLFVNDVRYVEVINHKVVYHTTSGKVESKETLEKIYARAKLFLFPSLYDTNSLVQIEAACQSTPTLFLKGAKTAGTVTENVNGFFAEQSEEAYAERIIEILSDEELYNRVAANARKDLYRTWNEVADMIENDYKRLIAAKENQPQI